MASNNSSASRRPLRGRRRRRSRPSSRLQGETNPPPAYNPRNGATGQISASVQRESNARDRSAPVYGLSGWRIEIEERFQAERQRQVGTPNQGGLNHPSSGSNTADQISRQVSGAAIQQPTGTSRSVLRRVNDSGIRRTVNASQRQDQARSQFANRNSEQLMPNVIRGFPPLSPAPPFVPSPIPVPVRSFVPRVPISQSMVQSEQPTGLMRTTTIQDSGSQDASQPKQPSMPKTPHVDQTSGTATEKPLESFKNTQRDKNPGDDSIARPIMTQEEALQKAEQLAGKDEELRKKNEKLREKDEELRAKNEELREKNEELRRKNEELQKRDRELAQLRQHNEELEQTVQEYKARDDYADSILQRMTTTSSASARGRCVSHSTENLVE